MNFPNRRNQNQRPGQPADEYTEKVVQIKRVSKKTKGGNQVAFTALVVVGDQKGKIGVGLGRAKDVSSAIKKAIRRAKSKTIKLNIVDDTISGEIKHKYKSATILLKPAKKGTGIIAGGSLRPLIEVSGIKNIVTKMMGSRNKALNVKTAYLALQKI
jgi:small subunit ribosomal protein S5